MKIAMSRTGGEEPANQRPDRDLIRQMIHELAEGEPAARLLRSVQEKSRLEEIGQLSCDLIHELRQPLFTISMASENLRLMLEKTESPNERMLRAVSRVTEQVGRAHAMIEQALGYVHGVNAREETGDLTHAAGNAVRFLRSLFDDADTTVECRGHWDPATIGVSLLQSEQLFVNLLRNAVESISDRRKAGWDGRGAIIIMFEREAAHVRCTLSDNGAGIADDIADAIFQPFFTTKSVEGTGLGLNICRGIVARGNGTLDLRAGRTEGVEVELCFPLTRA